MTSTDVDHVEDLRDVDAETSQPLGSPVPDSGCGAGTDASRVILPTTPYSGMSARGVRICRSITRTYAKTFYFASFCLPRWSRIHAYNVYAFCRWTDNQIDDASSTDEAIRRLTVARRVLNAVYSNTSLPAGLDAFRATVAERRIPRDLFEDLLEGMRMDLIVSRYPNFADLERYCYCVAGVVGLMMTHIFGYTDESCFPKAIALGDAMQLTNILRDIAEDLERGRIYLPQDELNQFGVDEKQLRAGQVNDRFVALMQFQIERARQRYQSSLAGIPKLQGPASRLTVRVMGRLYTDILSVIERQNYDIFTLRAHVPTLEKLGTLVRCQLGHWSLETRSHLG